MKNKYLLPLAASLGALATLIIPIAFSIWEFLTWDSLSPDGTPDNAPKRAVAGLLYFSPVFFIVIFLGMLLVSYILHSRKWVSKMVVSQLVLIFGSIPAMLFTYDNVHEYGIEYALESLGVALIFFMIPLSLGATVWWQVYHKGLKTHVTKPDHCIERHEAE